MSYRSLRLRASYGVNGTLPTANYGWRSLTIYTSKYMEQPGGGVSTSADANLSWETSYTYNIALEFGLFEQRTNRYSGVFQQGLKRPSAGCAHFTGDRLLLNTEECGRDK